MIELLEYVQICPSCNGTGETEQMYTAGCGMGYYKSKGRCQQCGNGMEDHYKGVGYLYKTTGKPVSQSVINQMNNLGVNL